MAALAQDHGTASLWLDLAQALRADRQFQESIAALESALRMDTTLIEGWKLLAEWADQAGIPDLAKEARQVCATLAPQQPKVESIVGKLRALRSSQTAPK